MKRIQSVPLVIGQFLEAIDQNYAIVGSTTGSVCLCVCIHMCVCICVYIIYVYVFICVFSFYYYACITLDMFELYLSKHSLLFINCNIYCIILLHRSNCYVRILSTIDRELLKPNASVALHKHSNALVNVLPPEADSSIALLSAEEKPDVSYSDIGKMYLNCMYIHTHVANHTYV